MSEILKKQESIEVFKVILMANWGLGLKLMQILHERRDIDIRMVITRHDDESSDQWMNCVYDFATEHNYMTLDQNALSFEELHKHIISYDIDLVICHSFMKIIPDRIISAPKLGCINIHPSLLPRYRGPSPTYWVLKNRDSETGLTCHFIEQRIDTGDIIAQVKVPVQHDDNLGSIIEKQKAVLGILVEDTIRNLKDPDFKPLRQNEDLASYAPRPENSRGYRYENFRDQYAVQP